jgi:CheY-like chemotaxis protein
MRLTDMRASRVVANVLPVDDDPENLWSLQVALESDGHQVSVAGDALRAMDLLRRKAIQFLITDYGMPGIDGAELCRMVRAQPAHSELPILMLSAAPEPLEGRHWTRFLRKPASVGELTEVIDAYVAVRLAAPASRAPCSTSLRAVLKCQHPAVSRGRR